jgi:hypothetical protein
MSFRTTKHGVARKKGYIAISEMDAFLQQVKHGIHKISFDYVEADVRTSRNCKGRQYEEDIELEGGGEVWEAQRHVQIVR